MASSSTTTTVLVTVTASLSVGALLGWFGKNLYSTHNNAVFERQTRELHAHELATQEKEFNTQLQLVSAALKETKSLLHGARMDALARTKNNSRADREEEASSSSSDDEEEEEDGGSENNDFFVTPRKRTPKVISIEPEVESIQSTTHKKKTLPPVPLFDATNGI